MLNIGCHLSASKGYLHMGKEAVQIGANTFQFFTRNPRGGAAKEIDPKDVGGFLALAKENNFCKILAHAPYTLNASAAVEATREFARVTMADDLRRMEYTPGSMYNIIDRVSLTDKMGVCMDTCHINDAGYDVVNDLDGVLTRFDKIIGLDRLKAIHINDTKNPFGSHKDRHEKIGEGYLGLEALTRVINHPALRNLPFYLETPNELDGYQAEIVLLRSVYKD